MRTFGTRILKILKTFAIFTLTTLALLLIALFIFMTALTNTVLDRDYMTDFLSSESTYTVLTESAPQAIEFTNDSGEETTFADLINEGGADSFIETHFDYMFYQGAMEELSTGVFDWLEGATEKPEFEIQIAESKEDFITIFSDAYMLRINELPACKSQSNIPQDPFQLDCKPNDFTKQDLKNFLRENQNRPEFKEFMQAATINSDDIEIDQSAQNALQIYQFLQWVPLLILTFIMMLTYFIYLLYYNPKKASRKFGSRIAISTTLITIGGLIIIFGYSALTSRFIQNQNNEAVFQKIWDQAGVVIIDISQIVVLLSAGFVLIGLLLYEFGSRTLQRRFLDKQE